MKQMTLQLIHLRTLRQPVKQQSIFCYCLFKFDYRCGNLILIVMSKSVVDWYSGQKILITGASGFMGKVLVEKLLRSCPKVAVVYILLRPKRGKDPKDRLEEFLQIPIFDKLRDHFDGRNVFDKLFCVNGDILQDNCGLCETDKALLESNVTLVFHMAADVRFNQSLKKAVLTNVGGTLNVLDLVKNFKELKAFIHVSTLYCHCDENVIEERLYKAPHNPRYILNLVNGMDEDSLAVLTPSLLKNYPNTYAYTKCLSEELISEYSKFFPIVIGRPSTVVAAYKEPLPGWLDNVNGPTGLIIAYGKGLLRSLRCDEDVKVNLVPVDVSINGLLVLGWKVGCGMENDGVDVYHIMTRDEQCRTWGEFFVLMTKYLSIYPFSVILWYPKHSVKSSYLVHRLSVFFFQYIPAYALDLILIVLRRKPFLVNTQKKISQGLKSVDYYTTRPWIFRNDKLIKVYDNLSEEDKETFNINRDIFDYEEYVGNFILGIRTYLMKEHFDSLPKARNLYKRLYYVRLVKNIILYVLLIWIAFVLFS